MNEIVSQSFGLGFENDNSRKNHPCPALLRSYIQETQGATEVTETKENSEKRI